MLNLITKTSKILIFFLLFPIYSIFLNIFSRCCYNFSWFKARYQKMLKLWSISILWAFNIEIDINPTDLEKLIHPKTKIIISNHKSHIDSLVLWAIVPKEAFLCFAAKKELFRVPIYGKLLEKSDSIAIDRENTKAALNSLKNAFKDPHLHRTLVIYAEGTRNTNASDLLPFKGGPFIIAKEAGIPILPVLIEGTHKSMPPGKIWPRATTVTVKILDPIYPESAVYNSASTLKNVTWRSMKDEFSSMLEALPS